MGEVFLANVIKKLFKLKKRMAESKRKSSKKANSGKKSTDSKFISNDKSLESMTRPELETHAKNLTELLDKEKKEKNLLSIEKNIIVKFLENSDIAIKEHESTFLEMESRFQHQSEVKNQELLIYRQKIKHLIYEQYERWCKLKAEVTLEKEIQAKSFEELIEQLHIQKDQMRQKACETELAHQHFTKELGLEHNKQLEGFKDHYAQVIKSMEEKHEFLTRQLMDYFSLKSKIDCLEVEEIKKYFNKIVSENLTMINSLKDQIEGRKTKEERLEKRISELSAQNKNLVEPLNEAKAKLAESYKKLSNWESMKKALKSTEKKSSQAHDRLEKAEYELEVMRQKLDLIEAEKNTNLMELRTFSKNQELKSAIATKLSEFNSNLSLKKRILDSKTS